MLIDTHAHILDPKFNTQEIIDNMANDGLSRIICVGYNYDNSVKNLELAKTDSRLFATLGIHPSYVDEYKKSQIDEFLKLAKHEKIVAIGEIGLDYHYDNYCIGTQQNVFIQQLELAHAANLPVVIHMRDADLDVQNILKQNKNKLTQGGVMHCYSGSLESAKIYMDLGFYISFSGCITFKNAKKYPDIIANLPLDRLLVETDCPYLAPDPHRGQLNYPSYVRYTAQKIADIKGISLEQVAEATTKNALKIFTKMK